MTDFVALKSAAIQECREHGLDPEEHVDANDNHTPVKITRPRWMNVATLLERHYQQADQNRQPGA